MVEVNRREQAKAELRVAASLVLAASAGDTCGDTDGLTEGISPLNPGTSGPTGGGDLPSVGSSTTDPWGNTIGYCSWDHGIDIPTTSGSVGTCAVAGILAGDTDTNNIAITVMSAGPDGVFQTTCADHAGGYVNPDAGGGDDIVESLTYNQAVAGSGGLWSIKSGSPTVAQIDKELEITSTGTSTFAGGATFADVLAANNSMLLPTDDTAGFGDADCTGGNINLLRINDDTTPRRVEVCDGAAWQPAGSIWGQSGDDIYFDATTPQVGIGTTTPNDTLDVDGTFDVSGAGNITGATTLGNTLGVTGATTLSSTLGVTGASTFGSDVTISGSTADNTADALTVQDNAASVIFTVQNDGNVGINNASPNQELDVSGDIMASGTFMIDGNRVVAAPNTTNDQNIFLGKDAGNMSLPGTADGNTIVGGDSAPNVTGDDNVVLGADAGSTNLTSGSNNILVGHGVDVPSAGMSDHLNIGDAITGDLSTGDVTIANDLTIGGRINIPDSTAGNILVSDGTDFESVSAMRRCRNRQ